MWLNSLELCGFRGFRDKIRIDFGTGFTVISGRNGVGKSTLCDAVEFALTGSLSKYKVASAAMETVDDYLWCEGQSIERNRYDSILSKTPISYKANRKIGGEAPSRYLPRLQSEKQVALNDSEMDELLARACAGTAAAGRVR